MVKITHAVELDLPLNCGDDGVLARAAMQIPAHAVIWHHPHP